MRLYNMLQKKIEIYMMESLQKETGDTKNYENSPVMTSLTIVQLFPAR
jgi:hypothetical protein